MEDALQKEIERVRAISRRTLNEETTKTAIVLPLLGVLGWKVSDPEEVYLEHQTGNGPVDFALHIKENPVVFIEVKPARNNLVDEDKTQLLGYCEAAGVRLGVLTNGFNWYLYPGAASAGIGDAVEIDLAEGDTDQIREIARDFGDFLSRDRVDDGANAHEAIKARRVDEELFKQWNRMLQNGNQMLVRALRSTMKQENFSLSFPRVKGFIQQCSSTPLDDGRARRGRLSARTGQPVAEKRGRRKLDAVSKKASRIPLPAKRRDLLRLLQKEPQATDVRVGEVLGITRSGAYSALRSAETAGHIRRMKQGQVRTCQVLVDPDSGVNPEADAERSQRRTQERSAFETRAAKTPSARRRNKTSSATTRALLALLKQEPSATQARVAQVLGITKSGAYAALKRAERVGHIRKLKHGRRCTYEVITDSVSQTRIL